MSEIDYKYIDLFSGGGGLSEGFISSGFSPIAHVEVDANACKTLETRLIYHDLVGQNNLTPYYNYLKGEITRDFFIQEYGDIGTCNSVLNLCIGEQNDKIFKLIDERLCCDNLDLIIGGPPCQAYSIVGRARDANGMKGDIRNLLYKEYAKFLKRYNPKIFIFENVLGLITADKGRYFRNMQSYFKRIGYKLDYSIQKAEKFGVLQKRKRIVLIGWKKEFDLSYPKFRKVNKTYKIDHLLKDLCQIQPGEKRIVSTYHSDPSAYLIDFNIRNGVDFVTQHITRPHNKRDLNIYKIAINKWLNKGERLKYPDLPSCLKTHKNETSFTDRFKVIDPHGYSHTMVAHIAKDGHHYIHPDKKQLRSISVREAARIQSFPDNYYFEGSRTSAFTQIGNAVPPLMAKEIAIQVKEMLCQAN